jgi:hypothetical protein
MSDYDSSAVDSESDDDTCGIVTLPPAKRTKRQPPVDESGSGCEIQLFKKPTYKGKLCPETCKRAGKPTRMCVEHGGEDLCPSSCKHAGKIHHNMHRTRWQRAVSYDLRDKSRQTKRRLL